MDRKVIATLSIVLAVIGYGIVVYKLGVIVAIALFIIQYSANLDSVLR